MSCEKQINGRPDELAREIMGACRRDDLATWALQGGMLPTRLSLHVQSCPGCAEQVRRISEVHVGLTIMCTQSAPPNLLPRANGRGLRMMRRAARASSAAERLLRMRPDLNRWQRAQLQLARVYIGAAAALLTFMVRTGVMSGFQHTRQLGEQLAELRWEELEKIDPNDEWGLGKRNSS